MSFNPDLPSVLFALNQPTINEDYELIRTFYDGKITRTVGYWKGAEENSYQIDLLGLDTQKFLGLLQDCSQENYLVAYRGFADLLYVSKPNISKGLGKITKVGSKDTCCTYCPTTNTYWKAIL